MGKILAQHCCKAVYTDGFVHSFAVHFISHNLRHAIDAGKGHGKQHKGCNNASYDDSDVKGRPAPCKHFWQRDNAVRHQVGPGGNAHDIGQHPTCQDADKGGDVLIKPPTNILRKRIRNMVKRTPGSSSNQLSYDPQ